MSSIWSDSEIAVWRPPEKLLISEWSEKYRYLSDSSEEKGPLRMRRTPYLTPIMDNCLNPGVEMITFCKSAQVAGTTAMLSIVGRYAHQEPCPIMVVLADEDTAIYISTEQIQPMFRSNETLAGLIDDARFNQKEIKLRNGAYIAMGWASSVAKLASRPIKIVVLDEVDKPGYSLTTKEATPISLAIERTETFHNRKILILSTPTMEDGNVYQYLIHSDVIYDWHVPCPDCGTYQPLRWSARRAFGFQDGMYRADDGTMKRLGQVSWEGGRHATPEQIDAAFYVCGTCGSAWDTLTKNLAVEKGKMVPRTEITGPVKRIGYHVNRLYSLLGKSGDIPKLVGDYIHALRFGDSDSMQGFINSTLAEPYEPAFTVKIEPSEALQAHLIPDLEPGVVPESAVCLTAGIDSQAAGFYYVVRAWEKNTTSYLVEYGFLSSFEEVGDLVFNRAWPVGETGLTMPIWRAGIDTGGTRIEKGLSMTEKAYLWLRANSRGRIFGCKGMVHQFKRVHKTIIDKMPGKAGRPIHGGLVLYRINADHFKETLHARLAVQFEEPGGFWVHNKTDNTYFEQVLSERKIQNRNTGKVVWEPKKGIENHYLDCEVYCMATVDTEWDFGLKRILGPVINKKAETKNTKGRILSPG